MCSSVFLVLGFILILVIVLHGHFRSSFRFGRIVVSVLVIVLFIVVQFETTVNQVGIKSDLRNRDCLKYLVASLLCW